MLQYLSQGQSALAIVTEIVALISSLGALYVIGIIIYRLTFHPLAKYPGPFLAKITDWYSVYHAYKGDRHLEFYRSHEKYGSVVRFGPNSLSFNSNTALQKIYGHSSPVRKSEFYSVFPATKDSFSTHSAIDKVAHARKRRVLSHAFSDSAIKGMEKHILGNIRIFTDRIASTTRLNNVGGDKKGWGARQNISDWCNYLTFDIMGDLCFGKAFGMLEKPDNRFAIDLIGNAAHRHLICGTLPLIHDYHLDKVLFHKISAGRSRYMTYSRSQALERSKMGDDADRKDFFYYLLKAKDPETGNGFSMPELWGESNLLIIAGSDTTSTALASTFFYLLHNSKALERATAEVRAAFTDVEEIVGGVTLSSCSFLRACLDEAMRMSPPVGGILPREVLPSTAPFTIDGHEIPAGTIVGTPTYTIHHNPSYFPSPFAYSPERWLANDTTTSTTEAVTLARSAFCPFSIGSRGCIGKGLAYTELTTALARTLFLFDLRLAPGTSVGEGDLEKEDGRRRREEFQLEDCFTSRKDGPLVEFRSRDGL